MYNTVATMIIAAIYSHCMCLSLHSFQLKGGETNTVELKLAAPRAVDLAERICGMANAREGIMPMEGFEPSTLAGPVFETGAYTIPPRRLIFSVLR